MKNTRLLPLIAAALLLASALLFAACDKDDPPAPTPDTDTQAPDVTAAVTEEEIDTPTAPPETEADTPAESTPAETHPADGETTETETVFTPPAADPDEAAAAGLPLDGTAYTVGGENPEKDPKAQYDYLKIYAHAYEGKTFTLYGNVSEDEYGNILVSVGEGMDLVVYFDGMDEPVVGSYVKVTAVYTQTVDMGSYVDFHCYTMMATACETLGEAKGPNGGKLMYITASSLNVRSTPDSSVGDNKVGILHKGDLVEVLETGLGANGNWCKIVFDCDQGYAYISMSYISETKP